MIVQFSMLDGQREVSCAISTSTMDELEGIARASVGQREAQFMLLRERIEACAAGKSRGRVRGHTTRDNPAQRRFSETGDSSFPGYTF